MHAGAEEIIRHSPGQYSYFERSSIERIEPFSPEQGIFFAGLDFIGSFISEINIPSRSAIRQINQAANQNIEQKLVDGMLEHLASDQ
ncbi:MAG: hypothetical protein CMQ21_11320 [Gammaproteobacteria bacterium]|nr:hypothetical protein [Gammaproteobacteria bacterium]